MDFAQALQIFRYWERHPPTHLIAAAFAGVKPKRKMESDFAAFLNAVPQTRVP